MSLKKQIGNLLEDFHKLRSQVHFIGDGLLTYGDIELRIHELRKTLEERENYDKDD